MNDIFPYKTIAVHSGPFHADDVFCVAVLKILNPDIEIIRTRDENILKSADMRVDVGGKYDPTTNDYDHHLEEHEIPRHQNFIWQRMEFTGPKMAGIGLIWEQFGKTIISKYLKDHLDVEVTSQQLTTIFYNIKKFIIVPIDIEDNGEQKYYFGAATSIYNPLTINMFIQYLTPVIQDHNLSCSIELFDKAFDLAVQTVIVAIQNAILKQYASVKDVVKIQQLLTDKDLNDPIFVLPHVGSWQYSFVALSKIGDQELLDKIRNIWFVVYPVPNTEGTGYNWMVQSPKAWNNEKKMYTQKMYLASNLRGKKIEELRKISGLDTVTFVHPSGFIGGCKTKEDAIGLAKYTLNTTRVGV